MSEKAKSADWSRLFRVACSLIDQANADHPVIDNWSLGGGTALMLQIDHRQSDDVDIFLQDPQLLPFLDPQKRDFKFELAPRAQAGDGAGFLKLAFDTGEIDFIVGTFLTKNPTVRRQIEGVETQLETVTEIIAKKVFHRAASLKPRDIFDIAAAGRQRETSIVEGLRPFKQPALVALDTISRLNPEFVDTAISQLQIKSGFKEVARTALPRAKEILGAV